MMFRDPQPDLTPAHPLAPMQLSQAAQAYLEGCPAAQRDRAAALLTALEDYLGAPAPLLAYTKLTGEAWQRTLPASEQTAAAALLADFRAFLRDGGWLDAARAVNLPD
ncbi:hypothetical protein [Deinococcus radiodurans]|jgi:hypothetical protein|uniref:Uncharacterized protein n=1 Tax=Deinococcus radiodurans (strain ATCC 13939 / DSM 20539 / JCM 16871 / CCUG 27074 / LMG 4051 / NBRC 15346 / NCIMB 9279 / VKM B-1422 / R1) TaxID=243230 RepID=Q9RU20_DEIRA|nr:hypothetical protein [Deinococcus radiodurans]AAF11142.1 hypothetical protein DR_1576 [Deinococcus radiodurans R1 = ATCC 13939 = DSM 20539]ANC71308.1 hypothetical protein A2G07_05700 [Deinococcus radiodurans R1 = ATCC 13939 = DSM 20539]QEM71012.1 hypothetical protein DXG80_04055 [Deinococcus radiodurans]QIP29567.1 hypothetical protein HAV23_10760 [Deinococcus radiodurans]QIP31746.1 hypothetical protein HAV35_06035 [Deinococcus radiodurans]